ncbi:hypothetical protein STSP2_00006 [Anaerohalosphaera lusitana]|uniref:Autotransporter domain-containing protein n=1 Tax=Anaerohalosphaera lusitana TaxID=1936003 RepID=A0A1U9NGJ1_9BACT|nr:autotransporter outer membrane beta-barrel domain-containing protein [Anaerohalosphaera lusitana]AQT66868.1 hypothetical protein STSP2_00006 [Anaerohalosphaera lusitana]
MIRSSGRIGVALFLCILYSAATAGAPSYSITNDVMAEQQAQVEQGFDDLFANEGTKRWLVEGTGLPAITSETLYETTGLIKDFSGIMTVGYGGLHLNNGEWLDTGSGIMLTLENFTSSKDVSITVDGLHFRSADLNNDIGSHLYVVKNTPGDTAGRVNNRGWIYSGFGWPNSSYEAHGISLTANTGLTDGVRNEGTIFVQNGRDSFGIFVDSPEIGEITNTGRIYAGASADSSRGIYVYAGTSVDKISNSGTIYINNRPDVAQGIVAVSSSGSLDVAEFTNAGDILVKGEMAYGITAQDVQGTVTNTASGNIMSISEDAYGAAFGITGGSNSDLKIVNEGTILAGGPAGAGLAVYYDAVVSNPGIIYSLDQARTLSVGYGIMRGNATLEDDFSVLLTGDPLDENYVEEILITSGSSLDLNNADLLVRTDDGSVLDTPYPLIEIGTSDIGAKRQDPEETDPLVGDFASVSAVNPQVQASWDADSRSVTMSYGPKESPAARVPEVTRETVSQSVNMVQDRMISTAVLGNMTNTFLPETSISRNSSEMIASADTNFSAKPNVTSGELFFQPYYTKTDREANSDGMGYDSHMTGFTVGYDWYFDSSLAGLHAGYGRATVDFSGAGYNRNSEDQDVFSGGVHFSKKWDSNLYAGLSSTAYVSMHDYSGRTGAALTDREHADYTGYGIQNRLIGGYIIEFDKFSLMPEAGIAHTWSHRESYTSDASDPAWDTHYSQYDDNEIKSILGGRIMGTWHKDGVTILPSAALSWEHALTDADGVSQSLPGTSPVTVESDQSNDSMVANLSMTLIEKDFSVELGYTYEYNQDVSSNGVYATIRKAF